MTYKCTYCDLTFGGPISKQEHEIEHQQMREQVRHARLAQRIKAMCPGYYDDVSDDELERDFWQNLKTKTNSYYLAILKEYTDMDTTLQTRLSTFIVTRLNLDEAVELKTAAKTLRAGYEADALPSPPWLDDALRSLTSFIDSFVRDRALMRLRELDALDAQDMTRNERKSERAKEREALRAKLEKGQPTTA